MKITFELDWMGQEVDLHALALLMKDASDFLAKPNEYGLKYTVVNVSLSDSGPLVMNDDFFNSPAQHNTLSGPPASTEEIPF